MKSLSDYFLLDRKLKKKRAKGGLKEKAHIKVALLAGSTVNGIPEILNVMACEAGIRADFYVSGYNQVAQDIINKKSGLYRFEPDIAFLFIDAKTALGDYYYCPYRYSEKERLDLAKAKTREVAGLIKKLCANSSCRVIAHNLEVPSYSPYGILEPKQKFGYFESIRYINRALGNYFHKNPRVFIFDYDSFLSRQGKKDAVDQNLYYIADMKLSQRLMPALCREYMRYIKTARSMSRKCIVLDLDNTLWGGILGEDGFDGIKLGPTAPGNAFVEFQKRLLALFERGVILAINSNNNFNDAMEVIRRHPHMVLKEDNFASVRINWQNKAENISEIADELNIGRDSVIYIDDSKQNRQIVGDALPEVLVVDLPDDPSGYARQIEELTDTDSLQITEEDKLRGVMYAGHKKRAQHKNNFKDIDAYLKDLGIKVSIKKADKFSVPRISQLTHRTNQFNITTPRYSEHQLREILNKGGNHVYYVSNADRFGDNGICGALFLKNEKPDLIIDALMLSCRVLGRGVEETILAFIFERAKKSGAKSLLARFIPSAKNSVAREFLEKNSFKFMENTGSSQIWRFDSTRKLSYPKFVKVEK